MNGPQLEDGFTRIANELMENVPKFKLNGTQLRIILIIWRYTYGFKRKQHEFSISFLAEALETSKSHVDKELKSLIERNVLQVVGRARSRSRIITFNKNYSEWVNDRSTPNSVREDVDHQEVDDMTTVLGTMLTTKSSTKKDRKKNIKKPSSSRNKPKVYSEDDQYYKMAMYLHSKVKQVAEANGLSHLIIKANMQTWADDFRKLVELDKVNDKHLIRDVIDWATADSFWQTNVLSAGKFRKNFAKLAIKSKRNTVTRSRQEEQHERLMREIKEEMESEQNRGQKTIYDHQQMLPELPD